MLVGRENKAFKLFGTSTIKVPLIIRHTWKPDPHSLFTVLAGVSSRRPDRRAVCLATYGQSDAAAVKTLPTTTESTEAG